MSSLPAAWTSGTPAPARAEAAAAPPAALRNCRREVSVFSFWSMADRSSDAEVVYEGGRGPGLRPAAHSSLALRDDVREECRHVLTEWNSGRPEPGHPGALLIENP